MGRLRVLGSGDFGKSVDWRLTGRTETEAIERALDLVISEHERNRMTAEANDRFVSSGIDVEDIYGTLES